MNVGGAVGACPLAFLFRHTTGTGLSTTIPTQSSSTLIALFNISHQIPTIPATLPALL